MTHAWQDEFCAQVATCPYAPHSTELRVWLCAIERATLPALWRDFQAKFPHLPDVPMPECCFTCKFFKMESVLWLEMFMPRSISRITKDELYHRQETVCDNRPRCGHCLFERMSEKETSDLHREAADREAKEVPKRLKARYDVKVREAKKALGWLANTFCDLRTDFKESKGECVICTSGKPGGRKCGICQAYLCSVDCSIKHVPVHLKGKDEGKCTVCNQACDQSLSLNFNDSFSHNFCSLDCEFLYIEIMKKVTPKKTEDEDKHICPRLALPADYLRRFTNRLQVAQKEILPDLWLKIKKYYLLPFPDEDIPLTRIESADPLVSLVRLERFLSSKMTGLPPDLDREVCAYCFFRGFAQGSKTINKVKASKYIKELWQLFGKRLEGVCA